MIKTINSGRGVLLFPEGNASYFGEQSSIPYSTYKFMKKMKKDVVLLKTNGAYLVTPRWASKRMKKSLIEINFNILIKGEEIDNYSLEEIEKIVKEGIKFNDYEWNKEKQHKYNFKNRAKGLERFIYTCPKCNGYQVISTKGNGIYCDNCGEIARFNEYGLLDGAYFENLVEWGYYQGNQIERLLKYKIETNGSMFLTDIVKQKTYRLGKAHLVFLGKILTVSTKRKKIYEFDINKIEDVVLTKKDNVSFDYEKKTYSFRITDPKLFFDLLNYNNGGH